MPFISFHPCSSTLKPGSHSWHMSIRTNKAKQRNAVKPATYRATKAQAKSRTKDETKKKFLFCIYKSQRINHALF